MPDQDAPFGTLLDELERTGDRQTVSAGEVMSSFQHRPLGVLLRVFGLIAVIPIIGGIPGVSVVTGTLILIAIFQSFFGGGTLWLPKFVRRRAFEKEKLDAAIRKSRPWLEKVDRVLTPRLTGLVVGRANRWLISIAAALLAISFYPLNFIPWAVTIPALGIVAFGLGLVACDGIFVLIGYAFSAGTAYVLYATLFSGVAATLAG